MEKTNKNLLLLIDFQKDFCDPKGTLFVPGSVEDTERVAKFIRKNMSVIDHIILTADFHQVINISHPSFWINSEGKHPEPFTQITSKDVFDKKWIPVLYKKEAINYIKKLEKQGEFVHTIWPEHCIAGTEGCSIVNNIMEAVKMWARQGKLYDIILKGTNPMTEHFGAIRANIQVANDPSTKVNKYLIKKLKEYKNIIIAGEARTHCVANTIKQLFEIKSIVSNIYLLNDCTSPVPGFENIANEIYNYAISKGLNIVNSTDTYFLL